MMTDDSSKSCNETREPPSVVAAQLFQRMDEDGDGEVTLEEFIEAAKDDPTILKLLQQ